MIAWVIMLGRACRFIWRFRAQINRTSISLALAFCVIAGVEIRAQTDDTSAANQARTSQYRIDVWQTEQGLPMNTVQITLQSRSGLLWVGTAGGLANFDGLRFSTFETEPDADVASRAIFGFMEDVSGALWIGHRRGAVRWVNGSFIQTIDSATVNNRRVWAFAQARDGVVWAASENGLIRWENGAVKVLQVADGLPTDRLRSLAFDREGVLWIGTTGGGLVRYEGGKFSVLNPQSGFPHLDVRQVVADPSGGVWASTPGAGLVRVREGVITQYTTAQGLPSDQLTALAFADDGDLWIGTWGAGVVRMRGGKFSTIAGSQGLSGDQVWSISIDRERSVWVGTWSGGLNRISQRAFEVLGKQEGLASDNTRAVMQARDGALWVTTAGGGVHRIADGKVRGFGKATGLATDEMSALHETRDGAVWVGTYTNGLNRFVGDKTETFGIAQGLPSADVRAIYQSRDEKLWVGTSSGLARWTGSKFESVLLPGVQRDGVVAIYEDRAGTLWFGTTGRGLVRMAKGETTAFTRDDGLVSNWILSMYEDADGALWVGTNGEGVNRFKGSKWSAIRKADGLWDDTANVILDDGRGELWMTSNRGLFRLNRASANAFADGRATKVQSVGYGAVYALRSTTFASNVQPAGIVDAQNRLWLPSLRGIMRVDPSQLPDRRHSTPTLLDAVLVDGVRQEKADAVTLPPGARPLTIRYGADTLMNAGRAQYRYRLDGLHTAWVSAGKNREAMFPALPQGDYTFRWGVSLDGEVWEDAASTVKINVQPRLYQTPWFIGLMSLGALASVVGFIRLRTRQLDKRHEEMERVVTEKTEELRIANDYLLRLSFNDALTGLPNRRRLDEVLAVEWRRAQRAESPLSVVLIDIDNFKPYNDTLGHVAGDRCLAEIAKSIEESSNRAGDFAARYGGEEFCVLIPHADRAAAIEHAENLRKACEQRAIAHPASPIGSVVTISLGVASIVPDGVLTAESLVAQADAALYRAKANGRNRVESG